MSTMKIKKGDTVKVIAGKDKDKEGLKQYVKEKFTESEIRQMKDLYNKYK